MIKRNKSGIFGKTQVQLSMAVSVALGLWSVPNSARAAIIISDGFSTGTSGATLVGGSPDTTNVPGSTYLKNGAGNFPVSYTTIGGQPEALIGADDGIALATAISTPVAYTIQTSYNNNTIGDTAGTLQRGEGLGFFSGVSSGASGFHGVGLFTGVIVSPIGDVRLVLVGGQGTNEPSVTLISDFIVPGYSNSSNHTLSYTADTLAGLISNVTLDGNPIPLVDTIPIFTPSDTAFVGFTASGNAGAQNADFDNFSVSTASVPEPTALTVPVAAGGLALRRRARTWQIK